MDTLNLVKDHQNSVKLILDGNKVLQEMTYSAYGETTISNRGQTNIKTNNVFYYTSRELEPETGDYFYRARYYDPKVGRFLSEDPIHFSGGDYNLYRYVKSQPVVHVDPSGKNPALVLAIYGFGVNIYSAYVVYQIEQEILNYTSQISNNDSEIARLRADNECDKNNDKIVSLMKVNVQLSLARSTMRGDQKALILSMFLPEMGGLDVYSSAIFSLLTSF